jgi:hypothetical protein
MFSMGFLLGPCGGYISRPTKLNSVSQLVTGCIAVCEQSTSQCGSDRRLVQCTAARSNWLIVDADEDFE